MEIRLADLEVGHPEIDEDHNALALLVEQAGSICTVPATDECTCDCCPEVKSQACRDLLLDMGDKMMALMLDHFHREYELMGSLPNIPSTRQHCEGHRREHVGFSTRYNRTVARIDAHHPSAAAQVLNAFILDWVRGHALEYDLKLADLLATHLPA